MALPITLCLLITGGLSKPADQVFDTGNHKVKFILHLKESQEFTGFNLSISTSGLKSNFVIPAGETYKEYLKTGTYNFTKGRHKQLFISGRLGAVITHIYDIDSSTNKVKEIYSRTGGRIVVTPKRNRHGGYDLEEKWEKRQWDTIYNRGKGHFNRSDNTVTRLLHWNGKDFVP